MINVIIDSSSAILLFRCGMIPALLKYCKPVIPEAVLSELTVPGYSGADFFRDLCGTGAIKVCQAESIRGAGFQETLHKGEREVITLFYEGKGDFVIIDDGKGGAYCRDNKIPYINALLSVKIFFMKGIVTEHEYIKAREWLLANGRYSRKIIEWAEYADEHMLAMFL